MWKAVLWAALWMAPSLTLAADDAAIEQAANDFRRRDADHNERLSLDELLANEAEANLPRLRQQFSAVDFNGDKELSWDEFRALPGRLPGALRGAIPDPIDDLRQEALNRWLELFTAADADQDGSLTTPEWPGEKISAAIPALAGLDKNAWDHNGDGCVDRDEGRWLCDLAYGQTRPSGKPLRTATGMVLAWYYTRNLDKNHDDLLSREEFVGGHHQGKEKNTEIFDQRDTNHDNQLDDDEMAPLYWHDALAWFLIYDSDRDGAVSGDEMVHGAAWGVSVSRRCVPAFDTDGNGTLSFSEFRATPIVNQMSNWWRPRQDADHDGRLSWKEFYIEESPVMIGLSRFMFDRFDLDDDGFLSFQEYEFITDLRWFAPEVAFKANDLDGDGFVSESELAARTGRPLLEIKRDMKLFDIDADGLLDPNEYATLPTVTAPGKRGKASDPIQKLLDRYQELVEKRWPDWDADNNGGLSLDEFYKGMVESLKLPAASLTLPVDILDDGIISQAEARQSLECLLGLRLSSGQSIFVARQAAGRGIFNLAARPHIAPGVARHADIRLRTPGGAVVDLLQFQQLDRNGSGSVDRAEYDVLRLPEAERTAYFANCDKNGDDRLSLEEWAEVALFDPADDFRHLDGNFDAYLDSEELATRTTWRQKIAKHLLPGFDLDGDGKLSLAEYRFTPLANPLVNWYVSIADLDGKLTFDEFPGAGEFGLLRLHAFECFDVDSNGTLEVNEFEFRTRARDAFYTLNSNGTDWKKLFELDGYPACGSPMVSPDGTTLAFDAWQVTDAAPAGPATVFHVNIDGTGCREVCQGQMPSWSPDGKRFACSRNEGGYGIAIMTLGGEQQRRIAGVWSAQWSPDGKQLAYCSGERLMVYDIASGESRDVLGAANAYAQILWNMCWSPDSKQICFKGQRRDGKFDVALVEAAGADRGLKVRYTGTSFNSKFAWHPTENRIVFAMHCPERGRLQLYQFDPTNDASPTLFPGQHPKTDNGDPCWTPDGKRLIVTCGSY